MQVLGAATFINAAPGHVLCQQGEVGDPFFAIIEGMVSILVSEVYQSSIEPSLFLFYVFPLPFSNNLLPSVVFLQFFLLSIKRKYVLLLPIFAPGAVLRKNLKVFTFDQRWKWKVP